jgi:hypothetical protein
MVKQIFYLRNFQNEVQLEQQQEESWEKEVDMSADISSETLISPYHISNRNQQF